jgi:4-amino-4-deoxy-L-arabinose transferase-like glycosyltransferase
MKERLQIWAQMHWKWLLWLAFPLLNLGMHLHLLDHPLQGVHAWRQCETASNVAQFAEGDGNLFNPHVYSLEWEGGLKRMEFPIMQWAMGQCIRLVGHEILVMRVLSWLLGMLAMLGIFWLVDLLLRNKFIALAAAWCWMFSPEIFYYSINPLPDNLALAAGILGLAFFMRWYRSRAIWPLLLCFAALSLSTASKLPFIVLFAVPFGGMVNWLWQAPRQNVGKFIGLGLAGLLILAPALGWYAWVIPQWSGNGVVKGLLDSTSDDVPVILDALWTNLVSTLPELLLNYASVGFFSFGFWRIGQMRLFRHALALPFGLMALATGSYFIFEINMITGVHDYYLFPFMPGIFMLVAIGLAGFWGMQQRWGAIFVVVALIALPITAFLRTHNRWDGKGKPDDLITYAAELQAAVPAEARILAGHDKSPHIYLYHLRHFGWAVAEGEAYPDKVERCMAQGAQYFYSDSRVLEADPALAPHLERLVGEWGSFRVWKLR